MYLTDADGRRLKNVTVQDANPGAAKSSTNVTNVDEVELSPIRRTTTRLESQD